MSLSLQTRLQPYREPLLNKVEEASLMALLFVLMAGVVFTADPDDPHTVLAWTVVVAIVATILSCGFVAFE